MSGAARAPGDRFWSGKGATVLSTASRLPSGWKLISFVNRVLEAVLCQTGHGH